MASASIIPNAGNVGTEIGYAQRTTNINVTGSSLSPTDLGLSTGAITYDGTPIWVEVFAPQVVVVNGSPDNDLTVALYDATSSLGTIGDIYNAFAGELDVPFFARVKITPSAGSHTYNVQAYRSRVNCIWEAGAGGSIGTLVPSYIRVTKA